MNTNIKNSVLASSYDSERTPSVEAQIKQVQFYLGEFENVPVGTPLSNFSLTLLAGQNPANIVPLKMASKSIFKLGLVLAYEACRIKGLGGIELLPVWAEIEALNMGSHQRLDCPLTLYGSGRWGAQDRGGHYSALLSLLQGFKVIEFSEATRKFVGLDVMGVYDALMAKRDVLYSIIDEQRAEEETTEGFRCKMLYAFCEGNISLDKLRRAVGLCEEGTLHALKELGLEVKSGFVVPIRDENGSFDFPIGLLQRIIFALDGGRRERLEKFLDQVIEEGDPEEQEWWVNSNPTIVRVVRTRGHEAPTAGVKPAEKENN